MPHCAALVVGPSRHCDALHARDRCERTPRIIRTGATSSDATEITDGIVPGQLVILHPSDQVEDGARIQVVR
jgi:hypothetical protein